MFRKISMTLIIFFLLITINTIMINNNVLANKKIERTKLKTKKQVNFFNTYKKSPKKTVFATILPGGGHFYNGYIKQGFFFLLENTALAFLYEETNEHAYLSIGVLMKIIEISSAHDLSQKYNNKLKKEITNLTKINKNTQISLSSFKTKKGNIKFTTSKN